MNIFFIILAIFILFYILSMVVNNKLDIYESFFWVVGAILGIFLSIFPKSIDKISYLLGVDYPPALFLLLCVVFLLFINFRTIKIIAKEREKVMFLAQEIAILKDRIKKD